ncbi:DEAD/DEAH box helicase [Stutzerimonas tarimensis]|uniref:ATP-dependent RNA helicase RhlE n=1 Tax=Stutzerimonas tarimensis TaxID=1507735 RepID=A0ABV7T9S5_9GAMM
MSFASLGLSEALAGAVEAAGYTQPTPVQQRAIPAVLQRRDLMVAAQTGTGKTGGFALPVLELLFPGGHPDRAQRHGPRQARVLVLTPTRELAAQVHDSFQLYARDLPLASACIFGGVGVNPQVQLLSKGVDVLVACPGRLLDLAGQGAVDLSHVEILVLDEADRMLDMGFIHDVKKVLAKLPAKRQNLLFSATFSQDIINLAGKLLHEPERIEVTPANTTVERIEQRVYRLPAAHKRALLAHLVTQGAWEQVLVFTRTKHGANRLAEYLEKQGLTAAAIHGNKSQNARTRALADFKDGSVRVLVATDIAARGLDIDQLPHVVNYELPNVEEDYVHRIGRTGRAGRSGEAISLVAPDEEKLLRNIERLTRQQIADGDSLGFDPTTLEAEPKENRPPRGETSVPRESRERRPNGRQGKPAAKSKPASEAAGESGGEPGAKSKRRNRRGKSKGAQASGATDAPLLKVSETLSPAIPLDRAPDEFLDDEVDNFGNSVDYVSPYQNQKGKDRGRRPAAGATPAASAAVPTRRRNGQAQAQGQAQGAANGKRPAKARNGQSQAGGQGRSGGPRRPRGEERQLTPFESTGRKDTAAPSTRQPVIVRKESKLDRLPSLEQLEQLEQLDRQPGRNRSEKPALLTRNH